MSTSSLPEAAAPVRAAAPDTRTHPSQPLSIPGSHPLVELRGISKRFPGVQALSGVSLELRAGEVHMLLGENGAGKSSLMKILCGVYRPDEGELLIDGKFAVIRSPADGRKSGIAVIFQEFSLVPYLSVAANIFLGREPSSRIPGLIDHSKLFSDARALLTRIGFDLDPGALVHTLGVAQQQMVEIAKALSQNPRVLVMDEPTSALSDRETERLFSVVRELKASGVAIVYISHRLPEVFALGDRITVLRDGRKVASAEPSAITAEELVRLMVGRELNHHGRRREVVSGETVLAVRNLRTATGVQDVSLHVRKGEIVGLCGLVGSGRTEVARAIFGADAVIGGTIELAGKAAPGTPHAAVRNGMGLIPESRKTEGLALIRSVADNLAVAGLDRLFPDRIYRPWSVRRLASHLIKQLQIATPSPRARVRNLSGGNQQKVVIGKWIAADAKFFIFDEPTRGIDVGAKAQIFALIDSLVKRGAAVLMISSEQAEIVNECDRAYVMRGGRIAGELSGHDLTEENIVRLGMAHD